MQIRQTTGPVPPPLPLPPPSPSSAAVSRSVKTLAGWPLGPVAVIFATLPSFMWAVKVAPSLVLKWAAAPWLEVPKWMVSSVKEILRGIDILRSNWAGFLPLVQRPRAILTSGYELHTCKERKFTRARTDRKFALHMQVFAYKALIRDSLPRLNGSIRLLVWTVNCSYPCSSTCM